MNTDYNIKREFGVYSPILLGCLLVLTGYEFSLFYMVWDVSFACFVKLGIAEFGVIRLEKKF